MRRRLLLAGITWVGCLVLLEGGLRAGYDGLPSLAGASAVSEPVRRARTGDCNFDFDPQARTRGDGLVVIGDSITLGAGLDPDTLAFPYLLASELPELRLEMIARHGADLCSELRWLRTRLRRDEPWPRVVVWEVFGDDLVPWMIFGSEGQRFAPPEAEPSPGMRWIAGRSYLANFLWFQVRSRTGYPRRVAIGEQARIRAVLEGFREVMEAASIPVVPVLLEPAGWPSCPEVSRPQDTCSWMGSDLDLLARMVVDAGFSPVDLRGAWARRESVVLPGEARMAPPREVPIHPNAAGHAFIAEAVLPALEERIVATR